MELEALCTFHLLGYFSIGKKFLLVKMNICMQLKSAMLVNKVRCTAYLSMVIPRTKMEQHKIALHS